MIIALTGTPGCGKTTLSKLLAKKLGFNLLELNKKIKEKKLYSGYDKKRGTYIIDPTKVRRFVNRETKKEDWIIDSHLSHFLNVDFVIVLRCNPEELKKRLKIKKWKKDKIEENVEAELIGVISYEARKKHKLVFDVDTTGKGVNKVVETIEDILKRKGDKYKSAINWID